MITKDNLHSVFTYHAPTGDQPARYVHVREAAEVLAFVILEETPACADQQAALRKLRECVMTANASIALNGTV
jgi:hypothetical protein